MTQGTIVLPCKCNSSFQDNFYGKGNRLHNVGGDKGKNSNKAYCTICVGNGRMAKFNSKLANPTTSRDFKTI